MRKSGFVALAGVASVIAALLVLGCGSGNETTGTVVEVIARDVRFSPEVIHVPAGQTVTIRLKNMDAMEHDLEIRGLQTTTRSGGGHGDHATSSENNVSIHTAARKTASVTFQTDEEGVYDVFCTLPGHAQLGMVAKLLVTF